MTEHVPASYTDSIAYFTLYDPLTGLPNEILLHERLDHAISLARRHNQHLVLLSLDLRTFRNRVSAADENATEVELQSLGSFLASCVRASDTVCHLGDYRFVILLTDIDKPEHSAHVADKLRAAFEDTLAEDGCSLDNSMSMALSVYPNDGDSADNLLQHAKSILENGRADSQEPVAWKPGQNDQPLLQSRLRHAVDHDEFVLHFQPQFNLASCAVIGAEAFVRWVDHDRGLIYPQQFMPLAEKTGLIMAIGQWVLQEACHQINAWKEMGMAALPVSVNISGEEFRNPHFVKNVASFVNEAELAPGDLELEITASVFMEDVDSSLRALESLKAIGIRLAVDCFGIGISSLRYLESLPFDTIKVDRAFLRNIETNVKDAVFLRSLIGFGKHPDRRTIVMGVESVQQLAFLQAQQCDGAQGFQLGHPLPAEDFAMLLATKRRLQGQTRVH